MIKKHPKKKIQKWVIVIVGVLQLHTEKHILAFICGGTEYNNLQPKLLKAGSITFFMLQDFRKQNRDKEGLEVKFSI